MYLENILKNSYILALISSAILYNGDYMGGRGGGGWEGAENSSIKCNLGLMYLPRGRVHPVVLKRKKGFKGLFQMQHFRVQPDRP